MHHMYPQQPFHRRPRRMGSYFLPFLSLIILGLIAVLVFQIIGYFRDKSVKALENKAAINIVSGRAEMKIWGVDQWTPALSSSILHEGDSIKTGPGSRVVLSLLNGSVMRLNAETEVELTALKSRDEHDEVALALKKGEVWLKRSEDQAVRAVLSVTTPHLEVQSLGTIFVVETGTRESVRVLDGKVQVAVNVADGSGGTRTAETLEVALGQEISIGAEERADLEARKTVDLLALLDDDFRNTEWYRWNRSEDTLGLSTVKVSDAVKNELPPSLMPESPQTDEEASPVQVAEALTAPVILTPLESERSTRTGTITVTGTAGAATEKLEVNTYIGGKAEPYILQKYASGSKNWSYVASPVYGNIVPGDNRYSIIAIAKDGTRSDPAEITIFYDKPRQPADLFAPKVVSFNGSASSETMEKEVKVEGTIGKGIVKVFVNDFALTRYVFDSGAWVYYAKIAYGNLKEGENEYAVYGVDSEGNKTPVTNFTITKNPSLAPEATAPPPDSSSNVPRPPL